MTDEKILNGGDAAVQDGAAAADVKPDPVLDSTKDQSVDDANKLKEGDAATKDESTEEAPGAPEAYAEFKMPEGFTLEGERLEYVKSFAKDLNLNQSQAQKGVEAFAKMFSENFADVEVQREADRVQKIEQWGQESRTKFGQKYDETVTLARSGVASVKSDALMEAFEKEGWGNHPELLRAFAFLGEKVRGSSMNGLGGETGNLQGEKQTPQQILYPNT